MSSYRNLVIFVLLLVLVGGGLAIWNADRKAAQMEETKKRHEATQHSNAMIGRNVSFTVTEGEIKKWKLNAVKAIYNQDRSEADLTDVKGTFYDKKGVPVLTFTAPLGHYASRNNAVILTGGVFAKALQVKKGEVAGELRAPRMLWDAKNNQVTASGGAELNFAQGKSLAQVCRFTLDFSSVALEGDVSSTIRNP